MHELQTYIADARDPREEGMYHWPDAPKSSPHALSVDPQPYGEAWWATGPLFEDLQGTDAPFTDCSPPWVVEQKEDGTWTCGPVGDPLVSAETMQGAIAKAWRVADRGGWLS